MSEGNVDRTMLTVAAGPRPPLSDVMNYINTHAILMTPTIYTLRFFPPLFSSRPLGLVPHALFPHASVISSGGLESN